MYTYTLGPSSRCEILVSEDVKAQWPELRSYLEQSVLYFYSYINLDDYYFSLVEDPNSAYRLWKVYVQEELRAVFITKLELIGSQRVLTYEIIGATDFDIWATELIADFERTLTTELDLDQFRVVGRPGWQKKMRRYGYEYSYIICIRKAQ